MGFDSHSIWFSVSHFSIDQQVIASTRTSKKLAKICLHVKVIELMTLQGVNHTHS